MSARSRDVTGDGRLMARTRFLRPGLVTPFSGGSGIPFPWFSSRSLLIDFRALLQAITWTAIAPLSHRCPLSATYMRVRNRIGGADYSSHPRNQVRDRWSTSAVEGHGLLGYRPTGLWREGDAKGSQSFCRDVSPGERWFATAEVHHRPLWTGHVADGSGTGAKDLCGQRVSQTSSRNRISNLLRRDVVPHWGTKSIHEIKKRDVSDLVSLATSMPRRLRG